MLGFEQKMADLEDRNRRCNIRVYGLHEDAEGDAPVQFLECMIPTWFPALKQLKPEIERAHRIFCGGPPTEGERPRAFIFCCPHAKLSSVSGEETPPFNRQQSSPLRC
ncbi:hypothetical protein CgunFtcFv8_026448 [Champsocephalus gunnari]|uniref:Uncharacterized protein n=1 Tax=Champsocephalus gunnari TaxID=52237 RepID=A0AAN8HW20_CHAGU|nr:hypothetical protein CgunFtcFv8_026448 [Champsocephalus gunnari]